MKTFNHFFEELFDDSGMAAGDDFDRESIDSALKTVLGSQGIDVSGLDDEEASRLLVKNLSPSVMDEMRSARPTIDEMADLIRDQGGSVIDLAEMISVHSKRTLEEARTVARKKIIFG